MNFLKNNKTSSLDLAKKRVDQYQFKIRFTEQGQVVSVSDGIIWIKGLPTASIDEILILEDGSLAMVFHLMEELVGAILLEQTEGLTANSSVRRLNRSLSIPVGDNLLGRVIDPMGRSLDETADPHCDEQGPLERLSPPIIQRDFVTKPLYTGNTIIDNLIPIGKGQRELIIGDNGLGKSSLALDIVINQKDKNIRCIYVLIGQKRSSVVNAFQILKDSGALNNTTIVVAEATALPGLKYIAPFAGCAIAEFWMNKGHDTLIVYDDLTAHANSYRELSLLLRRPPGREAFPADIFHLHARLLERSTCLSPEMGGGSMTALPVIETKEGEITTYIPTNLISITDGQIYFDEKLFLSGFLPAIDITKSVSRIGGKAQDAAIKNEARKIKLDYMQFLDLEIFTRFGAKLDVKMQKQIKRGQLLREIFKQNRLTPMSIEFELAWLIAYNDALFDELTLEEIPAQLIKLQEMARVSGLSLTTPRDQWSSALKIWLSKL